MKTLHQQWHLSGVIEGYNIIIDLILHWEQSLRLPQVQHIERNSDSVKCSQGRQYTFGEISVFAKTDGTDCKDLRGHRGIEEVTLY